MTSDIVVHIVDDEEPVRQSLSFLLASAGFAVRTHASAKAFLELAPQIKNGCLVTDLQMPDLDGVELLRRLSELGAMLPAIVVTGHGDVQMAVEAMRNGALDFIEKPFTDEVLIGSIRRAVERAASAMDAATADAKVKERVASLSQRELEVLHGIVRGLPNKSIALELAISPRTVEVYRANVMSKMHAGNLAELVRMVMNVNLDGVQNGKED